jgi:hypothetical protein
VLRPPLATTLLWLTGAAAQQTGGGNQNERVMPACLLCLRRSGNVHRLRQPLALTSGCPFQRVLASSLTMFLLSFA